MKHRIITFMAKVLKKIHLDKLLTPKVFISHFNEISEQDFSNCMSRLNKLLPDSRNSSVKESTVLSSEEFDLQIIVPAYNEENKISICVDSILRNKTKYNVLTIIVNDGSTDNTAKILQRYQDNPYIEIINQENRGFSGARNRGLSNLRGRYIMFVDSDDTLPTDAISFLLDEAYDSQADIIGGGYSIVNSDECVISNYIPQTSQQHGYPWGKIYKADLFKNVKFPENYWFEDTVIGSIIDKLATTTTNIPNIVYNYFDNPDGITHKANGNKKVLDSLYVTIQLLKDRETLGLKMNKDFYNDLLRQIKMNQQRIGTIGDMSLNREVFTASCFILSQYPDFRTTDKRLDLLEWSLRHNNFAAYIIACI